MNKTKNKLLKKLQEITEELAIKGFEDDMFPHVMGCFPDKIEAQKQKCIKAGISEDQTYIVIGNAYKKSYKKYYSNGRFL